MLDLVTKHKEKVGVAAALLTLTWTLVRLRCKSKKPRCQSGEKLRVPMRADDLGKIILWAPPPGPQTIFLHDSPYVSKIEFVLKLSGLGYRWIEKEKFDFDLAPKRKMPCIIYNGVMHEDSRLIVEWLKENKSFDLDGALNDYQKAVAHGLIRMLEESYNYANTKYRWDSEEGWKYVWSNYFADAPFLVKLIFPRMIKNAVTKTLYCQGTGRLSTDELLSLVRRDFDALEAVLSKAPKPKDGVPRTFFGTARPTLLDVVAFSQLGSTYFTPAVDSPLRQELCKRASLVQFLEETCAKYYPQRFEKFKSFKR